ncbi:MAG: S1C family serine protease [Betaproteobacteria bacterium]
MESPLTAFSNQLADAVASATPGVVQVHGRRRPASGVAYSPDVVITTMRAVGREDGLRVRRDSGETVDAELAGWDPATGLAVLRTPGANLAPARVAAAPARVGHLAIAIARSWSNAPTASAGIVAVIGGPLPTGPHRAIDQVIRTTAPMHDGFAGGALIDTTGGLLGIATAASIRGLGVVIPTAIAWKATESVLEHGRVRRGYLGVSGQPVELTGGQAEAAGREHALLLVAVTPDGPAHGAGLLVGDVMLDVDGLAVESPEDLLDVLLATGAGRQVTIRLLRGLAPASLAITLGDRPN